SGALCRCSSCTTSICLTSSICRSPPCDSSLRVIAHATPLRGSSRCVWQYENAWFPGVTNITKTLQHRRRPPHNRRAGPRRHRRRAHGRPGSDRAATSKQVAETRPRAAEPHAVQRRHLRLECGAHSRPIHENIPLLALPVLVPTAIRHAACNKRTGHTLLTPLHPRHARRRSRHRCPARLLHHHHHLHRLLLLHALDNLVTLREVRYLQKPLHVDGP